MTLRFGGLPWACDEYYDAIKSVLNIVNRSSLSMVVQIWELHLELDTCNNPSYRATWGKGKRHGWSRGTEYIGVQLTSIYALLLVSYLGKDFRPGIARDPVNRGRVNRGFTLCLHLRFYTRYALISILDHNYLMIKATKNLKQWILLKKWFFFQKIIFRSNLKHFVIDSK